MKNSQLLRSAINYCAALKRELRIESFSLIPDISILLVNIYLDILRCDYNNKNIFMFLYPVNCLQRHVVSGSYSEAEIKERKTEEKNLLKNYVIGENVIAKVGEK